mgnify:CR=1 FL=1
MWCPLLIVICLMVVFIAVGYGQEKIPPICLSQLPPIPHSAVIVGCAKNIHSFMQETKRRPSLALCLMPE